MTADTARFKDYVTSGAFKLTLSRQQVSALSMLAVVGDTCMGSHTLGSLHVAQNFLEGAE